MTLALGAAGLQPEEIGYINAHGTSTPLNEKFETQAIKAAFGDAAYRVPISSTKSMTGHLLGAAGALEAALAIMAIEEGILPPNNDRQKTRLWIGAVLAVGTGGCPATRGTPAASGCNLGDVACAALWPRFDGSAHG